jgi:hypothetical protein
MPQIKQNFSGAKMNKDLDERIVPKGQYRDALNIKISTSDGDATGIGNVGTAQNLEGNRKILTTSTTIDYNGKKSKIVASISDEGDDKAYFFTAAPVPLEGVESITHTAIIAGYDGQTEIQWADSIRSVETVGSEETGKWVFVDKFAVTGTKADTMNTFPSSPADGYTQITVIDGTKYRVGMRIYALDTNGVNLLSDGDKPYVEIIRIGDGDGGNLNVLTLAKQQTADLNNAVAFKFIHPERVLEFDYYKGDIFETINIIPTASIDILDNLLLWSDGKHEPKKINIDRSIAGTDPSGGIVASQGGTTHTKLCVNFPKQDDLVSVSELEYTLLNGLSDDIKKEHITVIKKAPVSPPNIEVKSADRDLDQDFPIFFNFIQDNLLPTPGDTRVITFPDVINFRVDDVFSFDASNVVNPITIRLKVIEKNNSEGTVEILFVDSDLTQDTNPNNWIVNLETRPPFFETKFGRFAYRYQYEDNEYSSFSPFSELAFLPGGFEYTPSKGFNEGMANTARKIVVRGWLPTNYTRPLDVKTIDILWKTTDDQNVYIVKSIKRNIDTEWKDMADNVNLSETGEFTIASEMIHRVVEANQTLRAWDNVPRYARAQTITSNRVIYGNYTQGYELDANIGLLQTLVSKKGLFPRGQKSVKSLRNYQFGIVIGDKYGRETPVMSNGYKDNDGQVMPSSSKVPKSLASYSNKFKIEQSWTDSDPTQLTWMEYVKYYVKETSNEYYNLVLDRVYNAGDGNVWLAFNSADRNKVDEETYLILKNEHGSQTAVDEEARYKIIAISNDAPDFIKTDERKFDLILIDNINVYGDDDGDGTPNNVSDAVPGRLIGYRTLRSAHLPVDDNGVIKDMEFKGIPRVKIIAQFTTGGVTYEVESPTRTITRIFSDDNGSPGIVIREEFDQGDVSMYDRLLAQLPDASVLPIGDADENIQYNLQFIDAVVENKPQFDGKFFVKVAKDNTLEARVLGNSLGEYQVLNTYELAFLADEATNPALDDNEYASEMDYEAENWETVAQFTNSNIGGTTGDLPNFINLNGDSGATDEFWVSWYNSSNRTADIFIDSVPAFSGFNLPQNDGNALIDYNSGYTPMNTVDGTSNWHPQGLSNGALSDGTLGQFTFSTIGNSNSEDNQPWQGTNSYFKSKMQQTGTLFRFRDDPNQEVYYVETTQEQTLGDSGETLSGPITIESKNFDNNGSSNYVDRVSIIVRFKRVGANGQPIQPNTGLDPTVWDPRGTVKHNGLSSMTIDFVERVPVNSLSDDSISTSAACFETEPKEDVGLDIYYEASGAIPVRLKQENIINFTGANKIKERASGFNIENRKITNNNIVNITLSGEPFVYQTIGDDGIEIRRTVNGSITKLTTIVTDGTSDTTCAAIGDVVRFENKSGLVTKSKILDHYKIISTSAPVVTAAVVPSDRYTLTGDGVNSDDANVDNYITVSIGDSNYGNVTVGMQVTGDNVKPGTFVKSIQGASFKLNQALITEGSSSFTFIDVTGYFKIEKEVWKYSVELGWFNCYSFGNGVESDRIRDDFNAPQIDNGVKVSSTFLNYGEENKTSGMIFSGLYNSTSSVNNLNEFNMAGKITKDLNTTYGSIQAAHARDNDVVVFTEDKVLRIQSGGKDALFNADGNTQLTATNRVLGTSMPFAGDYGISLNPESLAMDGYRMYFADKQRGAVLRLSGNGVTPISDVGMKTYFRENLKYHVNISGSFDGVEDEYNLTLHKINKFAQNTPLLDSKTISFSESAKGWVSFKSFTPLTATSLSDRYYSVEDNTIWKHNSSTALRNNFYNVQYNSEIEVLFNDQPGSIKSFKNINYEGTQAKIDKFRDTSINPENFTIYGGTIDTDPLSDTYGNVSDSAGNNLGVMNDLEYYNIDGKTGWYVDNITTDKQTGNVNEFIEKEGKWFNKINGDTTTETNLDTSEFSVQGIGLPLATPVETQTETTVTIQATDSDDLTYNSEQNKPF